MKTIFTCLLFTFSVTFYAQDKIYVHTATAENSDNNVTYLDHPELNNNPNACINIVHNWNPNGIPVTDGVFNDNATGIWYDDFVNKWSIFNEESSVDIVEGASFNVFIAENGNCIDHIVTAGNTSTNSTYINDPQLNALNPGPFISINTYYNPNEVYNTNNFGTYFGGGGFRAIFDENSGAQTITEGTAFKILLPSEVDNTFMTHTTTAGNITGTYTIIDHPDLNGNPNATFMFLHYWGKGGANTEVYLDKNLGVFYNLGTWRIFTEDQSPMPENVVFDIAITPQEILGINENNLDIVLKVYPNPTQSIVSITSLNNSITQVVLFNILGQEVLSKFGDFNEVQLDLSGQSKGTYILKIQTEIGLQTLKILKN